MAITASDIVFRYSTTSGSAGDTTAGTAAGSLGKYVSTTAWAGGGADLFDAVTGTENAASESEYRCVFVLNNHATLTLTSAVAYVSAETAGGAVVAIATDNIGPVAKGSSSAQAAQIANEDTGPSSVSAFSTPTTDGTGLSLGSIAPGEVKAIWVRRTTANTAALDTDGFTLAVAGDTAA
jgi:hypothetical protein